MEDVEEVKKKSKEKESRYGKRYGLEFKLRCVKLRLEEGIPIPLLSKEVGCSKDVIRRWTKAYEERGEGLSRRGVDGSFPDPYVRRLSRSRNVNLSLVSSGFPIY
jgi:transposase-like protein